MNETRQIWLRFLSGPDIDSLELAHLILTRAEQAEVGTMLRYR